MKEAALSLIFEVDWMSLVAFLISVVLGVIRIIEFVRQRSSLRVTLPKQGFESIHSFYFAPSLCQLSGNVSSFVLQMIVENRSSTPECITSVLLKSNNYDKWFFADEPLFDDNQKIALLRDYGIFTEVWTLPPRTELPISIGPYEAKKITLLFPTSSDNLNPSDRCSCTESIEEYEKKANATILYTIKIKSTKKDRIFNGFALIATCVEGAPDCIDYRDSSIESESVEEDYGKG